MHLWYHCNMINRILKSKLHAWIFVGVMHMQPMHRRNCIGVHYNDHLNCNITIDITKTHVYYALYWTLVQQ